MMEVKMYNPFIVVDKLKSKHKLFRQAKPKHKPKTKLETGG